MNVNKREVEKRERTRKNDVVTRNRNERTCVLQKAKRMNAREEKKTKSQHRQRQRIVRKKPVTREK